jgi:hypothetical protein
MPASHWAYELDFGNSNWLPNALRAIGIDPVSLQSLNNAAAIEFDTNDVSTACRFIESLLEELTGSDFTLAFPGRSAICTLHHHKQLWWQTADSEVAEALRMLPNW